MKTTFALKDETTDALFEVVSDILKSNSRFEEKGIGSYEFWGQRAVDRHMVPVVDEPELICDVTEFEVIPFQVGGSYTVGGCCCPDDYRGQCRCPQEESVGFAVRVDRIVEEVPNLYAIYKVIQ